jgi:glucose-1-phosphate thymidylyltransferase
VKGIILAGGAGSRLRPLTTVVSKQLLPVYNKPMIYYPLSTLILAGIDEILIICNPSDLELYRDLLRDGSEFNVSISYQVQSKPNGIAEAVLLGEKFLQGNHFALILGDNLLYGPGLGRNLRQHMGKSGATIFAYQVSNPSEFGVVEFDSSGKPCRLIEKPKNAESNWAVPGLYFYDSNAISYTRDLKPSARGELEITDLNNTYLTNSTLNVVKMPLGTAWLDLGTPKALLEAGLFIQILEERQGIKIGDPREASQFLFPN